MSSENKNTILLEVELDDQKHPTKLLWSATDHPNGPEKTECKGMLLSLFDGEHKDTFRIDLWTKEMQVAEMDMFVYQTLRGLADTYYRATNNAQLGGAIQQLAQFFGEEAKLIDKKEQ